MKPYGQNKTKNFFLSRKAERQEVENLGGGDGRIKKIVSIDKRDRKRARRDSKKEIQE